MVEATIDLAHHSEHAELRIKPEIDENLLALSEQLRRLTAQANEKLKQVLLLLVINY